MTTWAKTASVVKVMISVNVCSSSILTHFGISISTVSLSELYWSVLITFPWICIRNKLKPQFDRYLITLTILVAVFFYHTNSVKCDTPSRLHIFIFVIKRLYSFIWWNVWLFIPLCLLKRENPHENSHSFFFAPSF